MHNLDKCIIAYELNTFLPRVLTHCAVQFDMHHVACRTLLCVVLDTVKVSNCGASHWRFHTIRALATETHAPKTGNHSRHRNLHTAVFEQSGDVLTMDQQSSHLSRKV